MLKSIVQFSLIAFLALGTVSLFAQTTPKSVNTQAAQEINLLENQLNLSPEQSTKVKEIITEAHKKYTALKGNDLSNAKKETSQKIKQVLNPEQVAKYKELKKEGLIENTSSNMKEYKTLQERQE